MVLVLFSGCTDADDNPGDGTEAPQDDDSVPTVEVSTIETATIDEDREWSGRLGPVGERVVRAPISGRIESFGVREGDRVDAGQLVGSVSEPELGARRKVMTERRDHLREELERWEELAAENAAGPAELNEARLRLLEVEEQLAGLEASLGNRQLRSPVSGRVVETNVSTGSSVAEGQQLARIDDGESMGVRLSMPARETRFVKTFDALTVRDDAGREYEIDDVVFGDDAHRSFVTVDLRLVDVDDDRRRRATVEYDDQQEVLLAPWTAVASDEDRTWVGVITGDPPVVDYRTVELGRAHSAGIEVVSGLEAGDRILRYEPRSRPEGRIVDPVESDR